jgi:hypothetical protein
VKGGFDRSRDDVDKTQDMGYPAFIAFLKALREASAKKEMISGNAGIT